MRKFLREVFSRLIQSILSKFGLALIRKTDARNRSTMRSAIAGIAERNHRFDTVVDIGASNGSWSEFAMSHFPPCSYLLIEAQDVHEPGLKALCARHTNAEYALCAAGEFVGQLYFDIGDPLGGRASTVPHATNNAMLPATTVDEEIQNRGLQGPFLLKFDTHGFELPILKGAAKTLLNTEVIVMECYNYKISEECLLFFEMCAHLKLHGFRCIDLVEPLYRPYDHTFWQMDIVFVRDTRPSFQYVSYD